MLPPVWCHSLSLPASPVPGPDFIPDTIYLLENAHLLLSSFWYAFQLMLMLLVPGAVLAMRWSDELPAVCGFTRSWRAAEATLTPPLSSLNRWHWKSSWGWIHLLVAATFGQFVARFPSRSYFSVVARVPGQLDRFCRAVKAVGEAVSVVSHCAVPFKSPTSWLQGSKCNMVLCAAVNVHFQWLYC